MPVLRGVRRRLRTAGLWCAQEERGCELGFEVFPVRLGGVCEHEGTRSAAATVHTTGFRSRAPGRATTTIARCRTSDGGSGGADQEFRCALHTQCKHNERQLRLQDETRREAMTHDGFVNVCLL